MTKEEAWSHFYEYGIFSDYLHQCEDPDGACLAEAFYDGFEDGNSGEHYQQYLNDEHVYIGTDDWGAKIHTVNAYVAGSNYKINGIPEEEMRKFTK